MKSMTCKQLGGACNTVFSGNNFEEIAEQSKRHGMEMVQKGDKPHLAAMEKMKELMKTPDGMRNWYENRKKEFEALPENA